jgi:hypothetical protein
MLKGRDGAAAVEAGAGGRKRDREEEEGKKLTN